MYENCADHLINNLRLNEISILIFFQFYCKTHRNQLEIVVERTYGLHPNKYFQILNVKLVERNLVTRRFGLHLNSRGADRIRDLPISIDFHTCRHGVVKARIHCEIFISDYLMKHNEKTTQQKTKKQRSEWVKSWLKNRLEISEFNNIFSEMMVNHKELRIK